MKNLRFSILLLFAILTFGIANAQLKSWADGRANQEVGYAGLGNPNELLASVCKANVEGQLTFEYVLTDQYATYVKNVKIYARKRITTSSYTPTGSWSTIEDTFSQIYDYRDPINNMGAILLASTEDLTATSLTSDVSLSSGSYIFYLTVDIKSAAELAAEGKELPLLKNSDGSLNLTRIGGRITKIGSTSITNYVKQVTVQSTSTTSTNYGTTGTRVLVPGFQMLYRPNDLYSKFYRIPAITKTANGDLVAVSDARKFHVRDVNNNIDIIARRSTDNGITWGTPFTIMQGYFKEGADSTKCINANGYGDGAVAAFPNGTVISVAIHENGVNSYKSTSDYTYNKYRVSRDNGKTWGDIKTINPALYGGSSDTDYKYRGCIAPGHMHIVESGILKGKLICCLRTTRSTSNTGTADKWGNFILYYDADTDTWGSIKAGSSSNYFNENYTSDDLFISGNSEDEAQIIEVAENTFLMSIRSSDSGSRIFKKIVVSEATSGGKTIVWASSRSTVTKSGMSLLNPCNGNMMKYTTKTGDTYLLHSIPRGQAGGDNCRTSLSVYSTQYTGGESINWTWQLCLSDPSNTSSGSDTYIGIFGDLAETAQYSSLTLQNDGTIGMLYEGYPIIVRQAGKESDSNCTSWGDWVMAQYYLNLRIGDIIPGAEESAQVNILPPTVSPESRTYDASSSTDRPTVTIAQDQTVTGGSSTPVLTTYTFELFDNNTQILKTVTADISETKATAESKTFTWEEIYKLLGYTSDPISVSTAGYSIRVSAYCTDGTNSTTTTTEIYRFVTPVRKVRVVVLPTSDAASTSISTEGQIAYNETILTVGVGETVEINGPANAGYSIDGYYYTFVESGSSSNVALGSKVTVTNINSQGYQIKFVVPTEEVLPNNSVADDNGQNSVLTIYAVYNMSCGFQTRVNTNFATITKQLYRYGDEITEVKRDGVDPDSYANIYSTHYSVYDYNRDTNGAEIESMTQGDTETADFSLNVPTSQNNVPVYSTQTTNGDLKYAYNMVEGSDAAGLDAYASILPDAGMAKTFNAVVVAKVKETYVTNSTTGKIQYYLINGYNNPYETSHALYTNASGQYTWYTVSGGTLYPTCVGGLLPNQSVYLQETNPSTDEYQVDPSTLNLTFRNLHTSNVADLLPSETVYVEFYIINKTITNIESLLQSNNYVFKVSHPIKYDDTITSVSKVEDDNNSFGVCGRVGGATFTASETVQVAVYNTVGMLVKAFDLQGSVFVELPQGIYVANGKKFVVR